jgi:hypothetical protein
MQRPLKCVLIIAPLGFVCVALMAAMQEIHMAPAEPTLQQDRAELARLETQAHLADAQSDVRLPASPSTASNERTDQTGAQPKDQSSFKPPQSKPLTSRSRAARTSLSKRYQERQTEQALQRQRALAASRLRYAQQESGSFFSSIAHALGFSSR